MALESQRFLIQVEWKTFDKKINSVVENELLSLLDGLEFQSDLLNAALKPRIKRQILSLLEALKDNTRFAMMENGLEDECNRFYGNGKDKRGLANARLNLSLNVNTRIKYLIRIQALLDLNDVCIVEQQQQQQQQQRKRYDANLEMNSWKDCVHQAKLKLQLSVNILTGGGGTFIDWDKYSPPSVVLIPQLVNNLVRKNMLSIHKKAVVAVASPSI